MVDVIVLYVEVFQTVEVIKNSICDTVNQVVAYVAGNKDKYIYTFIYNPLWKLMYKQLANYKDIF